jgi:hypothetical protein
MSLGGGNIRHDLSGEQKGYPIMLPLSSASYKENHTAPANSTQSWIKSNTGDSDSPLVDQC